MSVLESKLYNLKMDTLTEKLNQIDISRVSDADFCAIIRLLDIILYKQGD